MTQLPLDLGFRPALGRADFLVASCNEEAVAWLERWPRWPGPALALSGPARSGKTHLVEVWRALSSAALIAAPALRSPLVPALLGAAKAAAVDDADEADEEALLHLYNLLAERQGHLLLVAREAPARWGIKLADLRSRLVAAPAVAVKAPDEDVIGAVLVKLFADRQLTVGEEVLAYLRVQLDRSFEAAHDTVAALDAASLADGRAITVPLARQVLNQRRGRNPA
jgi:chromosomal replication initiation ATPase DnaA